MKAIIIRPFKRLALATFCLTTLAGCSNTSPIYQSWEQQAYNAYQTQLPDPTIRGMPALFRTVPVQHAQIPALNQQFTLTNYRSTAPSAEPRTMPLSAQEAHYIAEYYGL